MATHAADTSVDMHGMIEIRKVRQLMDFHPIHWVPGLPTITHRGQFGIVGLNLGMTIHAGLRGWYVRVRGNLDEGMAISAVHAELRYVDVVRKRDRLNGLITDAGVLRRHVIPGGASQPTDDHGSTDGKLERQPVRPAWKKIRHKTLSELRFGKGTAANLETEPADN